MFRGKNGLRKRILSSILVLVSVISLLPQQAFSAVREQPEKAPVVSAPKPAVVEMFDALSVTLDDRQIETLRLQTHEKKELWAQGVPEEAGCQWQILHPEKEDLWVNISGAIGRSLLVTVALVGNMLGADNAARLRCRAMTEDSVLYSTPVTVTLAENETAPEESLSEITASGASEAEVTVISDPIRLFSAKAAPMAEGEEDSDFVTVTIEYVRFDILWENGKMVVDGEGNPVLESEGVQAFTSYVATLQKGTNLNTIVNNPTMVGYDTYLGDESEVSTAVSINETNITENITFTVKYKPAKVSYSVRYFFQNIYDDLYVEDTELQHQNEGYTGATPPDNQVNKNVPGFTALYYQPDAIAADGSTVFEVYYERNYYLMEFDCNGGYGAETVYVRYGTYISVPSPIRTGYVFEGWDLVKSENPEAPQNSGDGVKDTLPAEMPLYNTGYMAIWSTAETTYTIVYWKANLATEKDAEGNTTYSYWGRETVEDISAKPLIPADVGAAHLATSVKSDEDFDTSEAPYFTYDAVATAANNPATVTIEGDGSTIINVYYSRKSYQLIFYYARTNSSGSANSVNVANSTGNGYRANSPFQGMSWADPSGSGLPTITDSYFDNSQPNNGKGWNTYHPIGDYRYYYLAFEAEFGANIEDEWPANALGSLDEGNWNFGSWASESESAYRDNRGSNNANIVGPYPVLTAELIVNPNNEIAHNFVAWWGRQDGNWFGGGNDNIAPHYYHIYYEVLPGQENDAGVVPYTYNGVTKYYKLSRELEFNVAHKNSSPTRVDAFEYDGYQVVGSGEDSNSADNMNNAHGHYCNTYYYNRTEYTLSFYNHNAKSNEEGKTFPSEKLMYEQPIADGLPDNAEAPYKPPYPAGIEPGAYEFQDWYTTPGCYDDTEVDWENMTMPAGHLTVYAKWTPVTHTVRFYQLYDEVGSENWLYDGPKTVTHGELLETAYDLIPERAGYAFIGWFYFDEDNKKRFAPDSMEIVRDIDLFAEWQSGIDTTYEVTYVLRDDVVIDSNTFYPAGTSVADPTFGHTTAGKTKTFTAKGLGELYPAFRTSIFPTVSSHSILMDEEGSNNTYEFTYVHDDLVYYKIRYVDYVTRTELSPSVVKQTDNAIVTEKFLPINGYIPQNFYIRKALATDGNNTEKDEVIEENIITFYYTEDTAHGLYSVEHYLENEDSTDSGNPANYTQYESIVGSADKNTIYTAKLRSYDGYTHVPSMNTVITYNADGSEKETKIGVGKNNNPPAPYGTIEYTGLTIKIYYQRNSYPYIIEYREYGVSGNEGLLKTITSGDSQAKFDATVTWSLVDGSRNDKEITLTKGDEVYTYEYYDTTVDNPTQSMTIRVVEDGKENPNKLIFYYTQKKVEVRYRAVCLDPNVPSDIKFGAVSINAETAASSSSLGGSTATPADGFLFKGWFKDETCTEPVTPSWVAGTHLNPQELYQDDDWINEYYALFEPVKEDLKINKAGVSGSDTFLFRVNGTDALGNQVDMTVSIQGAGSVTIKDLYCGTYTVTELTGWSWTYSCTDGAEKTVTLAARDKDPDDNLLNPQIETYEVTFTNSATPVDWLHGESAAKKNQFTINGVQ